MLVRAICSAIKIQSMARSHRDTQMLSSALLAVRIVQVSARRRRQVKLTQKVERSAALVIQSQARQHIAVRSLQGQRISAIKIQSQARRYLTIRSLQDQQISVIKIQSQARRHLAVRSFQDQRISAIKIQSQARRHFAVRTLQNQQISAIEIQSWIRQHAAKLQAVSLRARSREMNDAATVLASQYRMWRAQKNLRNTVKVAVTLQKFVRSHHVRLSLERLHGSAGLLQRGYRAHLAQTRAHTLARLQATIVIQSHFRGHRPRKLLVTVLFAKSLLVAGSIFLKVSTSGPAHDRYVWVDQDLTTIFWRNVSQKPTPVDAGANASPTSSQKLKSLDLKSVAAVSVGCKTECFKQNIEATKANGGLPANGGQLNNKARIRAFGVAKSKVATNRWVELQCFSLISSLRTLDFIAQNERVSRDWVLGFADSAPLP